MLAATPANAEDIRAIVADLSQDWTHLSPRIHCLGEAGLKRGSYSTYMPESPQDLADSLATVDREVHSFATVLANMHREPNPDIRTFRDRTIQLYRLAGVMATASRPDLRKIRAVLATGAAITPPTLIKPGRDSTSLTEAFIVRECAEEYFSAAYGIGSPQGIDRYRRMRAMWMDDPHAWNVWDPGTNLWSRGKVRYFPRSLVSLNYLTARQLLMQGRDEEAFAVASDPVMQYAVENEAYATNFVASFHQMGIGTPRSLPIALAIYERGGSYTDRVEAASIKASLGRKAEAIADMRKFLETEWSGEPSYPSAKALYASLSGTAYTPPPKPGFLDMVVMIPLAILSYCATLPNGCATGQAGSPATGGADEPWKAQENAQKNYQQWHDWTSIGKPDY